jgi:CBS domain-containing protein
MPTVARDLMERNTLRIPAAMPLAEVQHLFVVAGIYGAPVIDPRGAILGVISAIDLLRVVDQVFDEDLDPGEAERDRRPAMTAEDITSPNPIWVSPNTPVDRVAQLMQREGIHRVLVGEGGELEGILTTFDLLEKVQA